MRTRILGGRCDTLLSIEFEKTYWSDLTDEKEVPSIWEELNCKRGKNKSPKAFKS